MNPAHLLIVDGESFRTPDLSEVMVREGWEVAWMQSSAGLREAEEGDLPDVVLFDPGLLGEGGLQVLRSLGARNPRLPMVALGGTDYDADWAAKAGLETGALHRMGREISYLAWPATLRSCLGGFGPGAQKFTTEDLFGDILAEMDEDRAPVPVPETPSARPQAPAPRPPPVFAPKPSPAPLRTSPATRHTPVPVLHAPSVPAAHAVPPPVPHAPVLPVPHAPVLPVPHATPAPKASTVPVPIPAQAPPLAPALPQVTPPEPAAASGAGPAQPPKDFTLSGIFGASDPFRMAETGIKGNASLPLVHDPWPRPPVPAAVPAEDSMEEFGNYYLLEKVAVGGMAELFKARQRGVHDFEKIVAIKRILPHLSDNDEFVRMFIDEAKLAAQLTHPNIVQIFDLGKAMGFYYIAMEFVDGRDLRSLLRKVREFKLPVPEPIAAVITMKMASALDYAHRKRGINDKELKLVHRDISPQNILISYEGAVKLVDFGIAKAATKSTQTMAGALKGKLLYMSPEQALGQALDGRSDIYSLGLVLFELLTGERCFQADSELGVLEKVRLGKVADVRAVNPAVSPEMAEVVAKALNKDVDRRYVSARFLERDLKNLLQRNHNEPNEHDLAEYANTVLKGTQADLAALLKQRYPTFQHPEPQTGPVPAPVVPERQVAPKPVPQLEPLPMPAPMEMGSKPRWLIPVLLAGLALAVGAALHFLK